MRMPQATRPPLTPECEAIRQAVNALADTDRKALNSWLWSDQMNRNDARNQMHYEQAERERNRRRPDPRQLALSEVA